jgi:hypothetical protein
MRTAKSPTNQGLRRRPSFGRSRAPLLSADVPGAIAKHKHRAIATAGAKLGDAQANGLACRDRDRPVLGYVRGSGAADFGDDEFVLALECPLGARYGLDDNTVGRRLGVDIA